MLAGVSISEWSQGEKWGPSIISAGRIVQKYATQTAKSVQVCAHSKCRTHLDLEQRCIRPHKNTVAARYPTASRLRQRDLVEGPQRAAFHNILAQKVLLILHSLETSERPTQTSIY